MYRRKMMRIPRISTAAMLLVIVAGCNDGQTTNGMSTEANMAQDATADDVLGANEPAANEAALAADLGNVQN